MPMQKAWWLRTQARFFPDPVAPLTRTVWPSRIHRPDARRSTRDRASPRRALK